MSLCDRRDTNLRQESDSVDAIKRIIQSEVTGLKGVVRTTVSLTAAE